MYNFMRFVQDIEQGREIEFRYNGRSYSITNTERGWQLTQDDRLMAKEEPDKSIFLEMLKTEVQLDRKDLKCIFDEHLFEEESLYIL